MATQAELITIVQSEVERLQQYLAALPQDAWTKPSACPLWDVRDVATHLLRIPHAYTGHITRGLQGDTAPPGSAPASHLWQTLSEEERRQRWRERGAQQLTLRGRFGDDIVSAFCPAWDPFLHVLATLNAHTWNQPCYHSFGMIPAHALAHAGLFELVIHGWDIRSALESSVPLAPDALTALLDFFAACPHWFFLPVARLSTPLRYRFVFQDASGRPWDIVVEGTQAQIGPAAEASTADATFTCERETFALLICRRMDFDAALRDQRLLATGDPAVAQTFKQWFQGVF
jgi:uncharacterized protein (TIGR03083 family)